MKLGMIIFLSDNWGGPGTEPPEPNSFLESDLFFYLMVILITIGFMLLLRYFHLANVNKIYKKKVYKHLKEIGLDHITADKISKSDQTTINKFLEITEITEKYKENKN